MLAKDNSKYIRGIVWEKTALLCVFDSLPAEINYVGSFPLTRAINAKAILLTFIPHIFMKHYTLFCMFNKIRLKIGFSAEANLFGGTRCLKGHDVIWGEGEQL